jgi:hypothetical protein
MNLYLVLALALGAVSGASAAPAAQPVAQVITERGKSCAVCAVGAASCRPKLRRSAGDRWSPLPRSSDAALTGGATPRAPARNC